MEPEFPFEFIVLGTPVSFQRDNLKAKLEWKALIQQASSKKLPQMHFAIDGPISLTLYYYPEDQMVGDIDNVVKLTLDAMSHHIYKDDSQVERIVIQKFEKGRLFAFRDPSEILTACMLGPKPALYIRVSKDPHEELRA